MGIKRIYDHFLVTEEAYVKIVHITFMELQQ